jgi:glycosyltransferase involved in cell wall biosynthesis
MEGGWMFSVVIPVYNHEHYLCECILSACRSSLVTEVLVLDDGSRDGSAALLRAMARSRLPMLRDLTPERPQNHGAHHTLNQLVRIARNEWIAVLNSDDTFVAGRFELIEWRLRQADWDLFFGDLVLIDESGRQVGVKRGPLDPEYSFPPVIDLEKAVENQEWSALLSCQNIVATTSNMIFRKSLFNRIGGFANYRYIHDWDFAWRASALARVKYLAQPVTSYRLHSTNTIKEDRSAVEREVRDMFRRLRNEFPDVFRRKDVLTGRRGNQYLPARDLESVAVLLPEDDGFEEYGRAIREQIGHLHVMRDISELPSECDLLYAPGNIATALSVDHLRNVCLCLMFNDLDFVLVSHTLKVPPEVAVGQVRDQAVFKTGLTDVFLRGKAPKQPLDGRLVRLFPGNAPVRDLRDVFNGEPYELSGFDIRLGVRELQTPEAFQPASSGAFSPLPSSKPVIFVLPTFLAVGGVERLAMEMMRQLRDRYDFVIVTTERLSERQGCLHAAAHGLAACFDLAELGPPAQFAGMLRALRDTYNPVLVWICNGSPWQFDNAATIREIFANIPIVDQSVYDTEKGWVMRYREPGVQSFDRFIAINRKIHRVFTEDMGMDPERIDLIYHAINVDNLGEVEVPAETCRGYLEKYGLTGTGPLFAFIGRLVAQKRPILFLDLARQSLDRGDGARFLLIGDGELAGECQQFIQKQGLTNVERMRYCAVLSEVYPLLSGLIITSEYEGLPLAMLEALSMGVPVLATDTGDIRAILEEYQTGITVRDIYSPEEFALAFKEFMENLAEYRARAIAAAPRIRARFCGSAVAARYERSWQRAMEETAGRRQCVYGLAGLVER